MQDDLRRAFARWGLPQALRVDNGQPWGSDDGLPPEVACWVIGLGVAMVWNPPYRPQCNGVVERSQGVGKAWTEPWAATDAVNLQHRLDDFDRIQREAYPQGPNHLPRMALHPSLNQVLRPYQAAVEPETWQLQRVLDHLAGYVVRRKIDPQGKFRVYNNQRHVGRERAGSYVWVTLDPNERRWVAADDAGREFRRFDATEVTADAVRGLSMCYRTEGRPAPITGPVLQDRPAADHASPPMPLSDAVSPALAARGQT